jgi:hypothetical protein
VVPAGQVIRIRDDEIHGELGLLAYLRTARGGRFTAAGQMHGPAPGLAAQPPHSRLLVSQFTAADDKGAGYTLRFIFRAGMAGPAVWAGVLDLRPDPAHEIGWLDLRTAPGEPATRIRLDPPEPQIPQIPAPEVTVTRTAHSRGELLLDVIAARILTSAEAGPQDNPGQLASAGLRAFVGDGPGHIVAALHAAEALPPSSPAPGQLAGLCVRLGIPGHGITVPCGSAITPAAGTPPATTPPDRWARAARSPWSWRSPRRSRRAPRGSTWWPPGHRPRSRPGCRSAGRGIHDSDPKPAASPRPGSLTSLATPDARS